MADSAEPGQHLVNAVRLKRTGRLDRPDEGLKAPRPK
jgi:hypothetical protein